MRKEGTGREVTYHLTSAPVAAPPLPASKPAAAAAPASLRAQIAALPPAELLALLDDLAPVLTHARALRDALARFQGP